MLPGCMATIVNNFISGFRKTLTGEFPAYSICILVSVSYDNRICCMTKRFQWGMPDNVLPCFAYRTGIYLCQFLLFRCRYIEAFMIIDDHLPEQSPACPAASQPTQQ